jgi:nucleotide-binding universal stress UspA family protein
MPADEEVRMFSRILVGLDGSDAADHALRTALELARLSHATVCVFSVEERLPAYAGTVGEITQEAEYRNSYFTDLQAKAKHLAAAQGIPLETDIAPGHAAQLLVRRAAEGNFDLVVIGHTGHSRLHNVFLGSTADRVVEHAPCPVLVVR